MKKIRLEIPLGIWKNLASNRVWLKCNDKGTEAFEDRGFTIKIPKAKENVVIYVNVPKDLSLIEVVGLGGTTPLDQISTGWCMEQADPDWKVPGLEKVTIIVENENYDIPVIKGRPDQDSLEILCKEKGLCNWAIEVYTFEKETIATLHWHPFLIKECLDKVQRIYLSKEHKIPCIWERGGFKDEKGTSAIVCDKNGKSKKAIYIKFKPVACSGHAMIGVTKGDVIVKAVYDAKTNQCNIRLLQIEYIDVKYREAEVNCIAKYNNYGWKCNFGVKKLRQHILECSYGYWYHLDVARKYKKAILAAFDKATCDYCKEVHFVSD